MSETPERPSKADLQLIAEGACSETSSVDERVSHLETLTRVLWNEALPLLHRRVDSVQEATRILTDLIGGTAGIEGEAAEVVRARKFELVDEDGKTRAELQVEDEGVSLTFYNAGMIMLSLGMHLEELEPPTSYLIFGGDDRGYASVHLHANGDTASVTVSDKSGFRSHGLQSQSAPDGAAR